MMHRRQVLASLPVIAATACGDVPLPQTRPPIPARFPYAPAETGWPDPSWWQAFGSAELNALVDAAATGNRDLLAAAERIIQAEAGARADRASLFPSLGFGASTSTGTNSGPGSWTAGVDASWEVDLWGRLRSAARAGDMRTLSSRFDRDALALSVMAETATGYFQLLAFRARRTQASETLTVARRILGVVMVQVSAGGSSDLETQQQRSAVAAQEASLAELTGRERQQLHALALLAGVGPEEVIATARSLEGLSLPPVVAGLPADLLARRPDIARAEADLVAAGLDARIARDARLPSLTLTGSAGRSTTELADLLLSPGRLATRIIASLGAPLFEGGRLRAAEDQAMSRMRELAQRYAATILEAFRDVADALAATEAAREAYALRRLAFDSASRAYRIGDVRWRAGGADFLSVLQSQQALFSTADLLAQADAARYSAAVALYRALGGGWQVPPGLRVQG
ncbi:efflux transporter outer membrane subunit [Humitalea sp. 24SJ18S-53]|uniref:efflux transporter outer membrane subunit n=1 Tax=Humitalea sp. 24SJ18S-53 TaxID=3422307 RepID=UPI003D673BFD